MGLGVMGKNHLRVLEALADVSEVLVFDPVVHAEPGAKKTTSAQSLSEVLDSDLDYLVIATPTSSHVEIASHAARAGIPCLIEKPLAASLSEALSLEREFAKTETFVAIGHAERFNSSIVALKEKLDSGLLGAVYHVSTERVGPNPIRIRDVGVVLDLATHDLDLVQWVLGDSYIDLSATLTSQAESDYEGLFVANGKLSSGVSVSHNVNWLTPLKRREFSVLGERGMLVADALRAELRLYSMGSEETRWSAIEHITGSIVGEEIKFALSFDEPLKLQHQAMAQEIAKHGETNICKLGDAIGVLRVIDDFIY